MAEQTVREVFQKRITKGDVGIEIEVEGDRLPKEDNMDNKFYSTWRVERDGSLRGGGSREYVTKGALAIDKVDAALNKLDVAFKKRGSIINETIRAGVHVHINVQNLTMKQLFTFITCYLTLEEVLISFCGDGRAGNHFCLRADDAEYSTYTLSRAIRDKEVDEFYGDNIRYSAINVNSLPKYGSVEFRAMGTSKDLTKIASWSKMLHQLKESSLKFDNPQEVIYGMSNEGAELFVDMMLGEWAPLFKDLDLEGLVTHGVRHAQDVAFAIQDWEGYDFPK